MTLDWRVYAIHIMDAIDTINDYKSEVDGGQAREDMAYDAIYRNLETLCEAAIDKIPDAIKSKHDEINWKAIGGMRVQLAHIYLSIDRKIIDQTIAKDLPALYKAMEAEVPDRSIVENGSH